MPLKKRFKRLINGQIQQDVCVVLWFAHGCLLLLLFLSAMRRPNSGYRGLEL